MRLMRNDRRSSNGERLADHYESLWCRVIGCYPVTGIPNPLHPLLPPLPEPNPIFTGDPGRYTPGTFDSGPLPIAMQMASDGQVEEKPASDPPRPIETMREWSHGEDDNVHCPDRMKPIFRPPQELPDPCRTCGGDTWNSRGVVERDVETGDIYRRDGKAVPRERT